LGTFITDMNLGIYTAKLDRARTILATSESIKVRYHQYADVEFTDYLHALARMGSSGRTIGRKHFKHPNPHVGPKPLEKRELTEPLDMAQVMRILAIHLNEDCCVVSDVGDAIFGAVGIRTARRAEFIAPAYYLSMGFAVPASIGVEVAN